MLEEILKKNIKRVKIRSENLPSEYCYLENYLDYFSFISTEYLPNRIDFVSEKLGIDKEYILKSIFIEIENRVYSFNLPGNLKLDKNIIAKSLNISKNKAKRFKFSKELMRFGTYTPLIPFNLKREIEKIVLIDLPDDYLHLTLGSLTYKYEYLSAFIHKKYLVKILKEVFYEKVIEL